MAIQKRFYLSAALFLLFFSWLQPLPAQTETGNPTTFSRALALSGASLSEDFEDGLLDSRISIQTTGTFRSQPGIKDISNFGSDKAFGFGKSNCNWGCQDNNVTRLYIRYPAPVFVYSLSFKEMELYGNWGNGGKIYVDGVPVSGADTRELGREPYNDRQPDITYRTKLIMVNQYASEIEFRVRDITFESEIFLDDLHVSGECSNPPDGIVSWWSGDGHPFDLVDGNHGSMQNGTAYAPGMVGKSFDFDGVDDYVRVADNASLQEITDHFSIEAWVKPLSLPSGDDYYGSTIVEREDFGRGFALATKGDRLGLWIGPGSVSFVVAASDPISIGNWYHVIGTYDGSIARIYVNGVLEDTQVGTIANINLDLNIGSARGSLRFFDDLIDEVTIFDQVLNAEEVLQLFNAGSAGKCVPCFPPPANMVAWWPFNEEMGATTIDLVGGNNGTINGAARTTGNVAKALSFDGVDDYVALPGAVSSLLSNSAGTITVWVYPTSIGDNDVIVAFGTASPGQGIGLGIWNNVRPWHASAPYDWDSTTSVNVDEWTFLVYAWDDTAEYIYKNGEFSESRARNFNYLPGQARIGHGFWGDPANAFPGLIDEVQVYGRAMTAEEIAALYSAGCAGTCWVYHTLYLPILWRKNGSHVDSFTG